MNARRLLSHARNPKRRLTPGDLLPTFKAGWREIGGVRKYYRSRWEANYARYLNWLVVKKQHFTRWSHEPRTFWFPEIKRGVRSYLPDFEVERLDGTIEYHEVKGYLDPKSITKLRRMAKYYPEIKLVLINRVNYMAIAKMACRLVQGWEADS